MTKTAYERMEELNKENEILFKIALGEILHKGIDKCLEIKDEQIENAKIPMFADDWAKTLVRFMREISRIEKEEHQTIYKYIQTEKIYNTNGFKPRKKKNG